MRFYSSRSRAFPLFLFLSTVTEYTTAQRYFIQPEGLDESATGDARFDSSIQWYIGDQVTVRWEADFDSVTLRLWQGVWDGKYWYDDLLRDDSNTLTYTWTVKPVLSQAQDLNLHFQLLDPSNTKRNFNSKDFRIYNRTDTLTETLRTTTKERTVTKEVTVTPSADIGSSSSPTTTDTAATIGANAGTSTAATSDGSPLPTSINTNSDNTAMKVGLGVGLGLGLPLLALIGGGLYFLGKKRGKGGLSDMPSVPAVSSSAPEAGWYPGATIVGGIENTGSQVGGAMAAPRR
ncbi:hypothetical protein TWF718_009131 [Orbilia javanica]|uniref:Mid2 domain-containing protein n=1 Tax=Orbilia javanica TaxID=47235 RepID=A0AAN8NSF8_9PEZI